MAWNLTEAFSCDNLYTIVHPQKGAFVILLGCCDCNNYNWKHTKGKFVFNKLNMFFTFVWLKEC